MSTKICLVKATENRQNFCYQSDQTVIGHRKLSTEATAFTCCSIALSRFSASCLQNVGDPDKVKKGKEGKLKDVDGRNAVMQANGIMHNGIDEDKVYK